MEVAALNQQRKLSFDMIRIIAVTMVVMIHVSAYTLVVFVLAFGLSFLLTWGLYKIKGVKKLVRG